MKLFMAIVLVLVLATSALALEKKAYTMREDFGTEPLYDCALNYYYYIPCPTYSWFWAFTGWEYEDIIGTWYTVGDMSMGGWATCDPATCFELEQIRILDFAGYGIQYPGWFSVIFDVYCADALGCPVGEPLWTSTPQDFGFGWNYVVVDPPICLDDCATITDPALQAPRIVVTATHIGTNYPYPIYPAWGMDNISTAIEVACELHEDSCLDALYPRPMVSHYAEMHSGYFGQGAFTYCPVYYFCDGRDTSANCDLYGGIELCWRIYLICQGPTATEPSTWGNIKSMYR